MFRTAESLFLFHAALHAGSCKPSPCAYNAQSRRFQCQPVAPQRLGFSISLKYKPLGLVSSSNLLSPCRHLFQVVYRHLDASLARRAEIVVSGGRQPLYRRLKRFMSFASFGASNPEEYRLREDFLRYTLLQLVLQPANGLSQLTGLPQVVRFLGKARLHEGKAVLVSSLEKYRPPFTRATTVEPTSHLLPLGQANLKQLLISLKIRNLLRCHL